MNEKEARGILGLDKNMGPVSYDDAREARRYLEAIEKAKVLTDFISEWGALMGGEFEIDCERILAEWEKEK